MSKIHVLPDENLGGVLREYVEVNRVANTGDKVYIPGDNEYSTVEYRFNTFEYTLSDGCNILIRAAKTLEPTDIVHIYESDDICGVYMRYRLVDRKAKVGEKIIVVDAHLNGESYKNGDIFIVREVRHSVIFVTVDSGRYIALSHFEYKVLEPVEPAELVTAEEGDDKSVIDLLANLARRVTELERKLGEYARKIDGIEADIQNINIDLGTVEGNVEKILDDIVTLDERTQPLAAVLSALAKAVKADE